MSLLIISFHFPSPPRCTKRAQHNPSTGASGKEGYQHPHRIMLYRSLHATFSQLKQLSALCLSHFMGSLAAEALAHVIPRACHEVALALSKNTPPFVKSTRYPAMTPSHNVGSNHHPWAYLSPAPGSPSEGPFNFSR